ncbi:MAG: hypothetical protein ACHQQ3_04485 [Gemmatimonadales bacterium]
MFSCLGRLGCLVVVLLIAAVAWFTQDAWLPRVRARVTGPPPATAEVKWEPLTAEGAARGRAALEKLSEKNGPVYVNVSAGDFASVVLDSVIRGFGSSATGTEAIVRDDRLYLRAALNVADLGGPSALGPLSGVVNGRQELTVRGRLELLKPGHAQFRVDEISVGELKLPAAVIPRLIERIATRERDGTIAADGLPVQVPRSLGDLRVGKGRVTLYKNVP